MLSEKQVQQIAIKAEEGTATELRPFYLEATGKALNGYLEQEKYDPITIYKITNEGIEKLW